MAFHALPMRAHFPAALVAASLLFAPLSVTPANADQTPTPLVTLSPLEQYKIDVALYLDKLKSREIEMRLLNQNFKIAIEKARRAYLIALRSAKGPTDKSLLSAKFDEVKSSAAATLESARENLGPIPTPPVEPPKGAKSKMSRENQTKKSR